jgi:hypothetical protein
MSSPTSTCRSATASAAPVALLARLQQDGWSENPRAIAADRETALHIDPADGTAESLRRPDHPTPYVYFMSQPVRPVALRAGAAPDGPP